MKRNASSSGFTLIELLIVIALIAVLAGAVVIALNPARQFAASRDSQRWSHVSAIVGAITQNITENRGSWTCPSAGALPTTSTAMGTTGFNICGCLVPSQMAVLPVDPTTGSFTSCSAAYSTGYEIIRATSTGRVTISAPSAENGTVTVTQ